jgi:hypothetical protein
VENYHIANLNKSPVYHLSNLVPFFAFPLSGFVNRCVLISEQGARSSEVFQSIQQPRLFYFPDLSGSILPNALLLA